MFNLEKTLEELENDYWPEQQEYTSSLIEQCHKYRKVKLQDLSVEQLRLLIGQNIGLEFLIPLAYEKLNENILASGDYYKGDLLTVVLKSDTDFWNTNPQLTKKMFKLLKESENSIQNYKMNKGIKKDILDSINHFKNNCASF